QAGLGWKLGLSLALVAGAAACSGDDEADASDDSEDTSGEGEGDSEEGGDVAEPELRDELLEMMDADQAERTGEVGANNDAERTARLGEIIDEHGWPTFELVGRDGATAAWVIA